MGNCASAQTSRRTIIRPSTAKVIHVDGSLEEFDQPIRAGHVTAQNPNCFLCSSESMYVGSHVPQVEDDDELQLGQIYFLMPIENSQVALSLPQLCNLAVKANSALSKHVGSASLSGSFGVRFPASCCSYSKIPAMYDHLEGAFA